MDDVPGRIEHTVLGPATTWAEVTDGLDAAIRYGTRACVPPWAVADATTYAPSVDLVTVVGFPHGQHATTTKVAEATTAVADGASEVDLVPNHGSLLAGEDEGYADGIGEVVASVAAPVKVIVETGLLSADARDRACEAAVEADAAFLKTSTGFLEGGATAEDVAAMAEYAPVKASGGIGSWDEAERMFDAGAARIGASSGDAIVGEYREATDGEE